MGISKSGQTVDTSCELQPVIYVVRPRSVMENADLWNEFETVLRLNDTRRLEFVWVRGHAAKAHIDRQVTTTLNKGGNEMHWHLLLRHITRHRRL